MQYFNGTSCIVDMLVNHVPSPLINTKNKLEKYYSGKKVFLSFIGQ
jgi:hypothetical protein